MIPMNLLIKNAVADYTDTGSWSYKALNQAKLFGKVNIASSSRTSNYSFIPKEIKYYILVNENNDKMKKDKKWNITNKNNPMKK